MNNGRVQYSQQKILRGLDSLAHKIATIGLSAQIISPMFDGKINGKSFTVNSETMPLVIILQDAIRFIYGRLGRCYFDNLGKDKNTASINILFDQIFNNPADGKNLQKTYKEQFDAIKVKLENAKKYKSKLNKFCNKHYAHTNIRSLEDIQADEVQIAISWSELIGLIDDAKDIIKKMFEICKKPSYNFSEHVYVEYKNQFWSLIDFHEINDVLNLPHSTKDER